MNTRRRRRLVGKALVGGGLLLALQAGPAAAAEPRVKGCLGVDTSAGAKNGSNGTLRSWLAVDGNEIFGAGVSFGDIIQAHQRGYLGGTCAS